jgi:nucleotide-binding universal stress UspA family protein
MEASMNAPADRPIIVGIDGSQEGQRALDWGVDEALRRSRPLVVVHAFDLIRYASPLLGEPSIGERRQAAESLVAETVSSLRDNPRAQQLDIRPVVETGRAPGILLEQGTDAEMLVVGSRGLGGFTDLLLGSTSLQVASHATRPVVVIRGGDEASPGPSAGRVVVGFDESEHSRPAMAFAFEAADVRAIGLTAVHAWMSPPLMPTVTPPYEWQQAATDEQSVLAAALASWRDKFPNVSTDAKAVRGDPATALIDESRGAELLVVGSRGAGGFRGLLLGAVSHAVLHHARCPVALVRG